MVSPAGPSLVAAAKSSPAVLVFVSDPAAKIISDLTVLADLFGFTPAESRPVLALLSGVALPEFARQSGVSYHTVRTLLGRGTARTETRSQLELVLLVARSLGGVVAPSQER
jgi:DNA-binding CsgD family transcriptional regulator